MIGIRWIRSLSGEPSMYSRSSRVSSSFRPPTIARWARGRSGATFSKASTRETCALRGSTVPTQTTSSASSGIPAARRASARSNSAAGGLDRRRRRARRGSSAGCPARARARTARGSPRPRRSAPRRHRARPRPGGARRGRGPPRSAPGEALVDRPDRRDPEPLRDLDPGEGRDRRGVDEHQPRTRGPRPRRQLLDPAERGR